MKNIVLRQLRVTQRLELSAGLVLASGLALCGQDLRLAAPPAGLRAGEPIATERTPHSTRWVRLFAYEDPQGVTRYHKSSFVQLANGLNWWNADTKAWEVSVPVIEPFAGGAVARRGRQKVVFSPELNVDGAVDIQTPDGKRLRATALGLAYHDPTSGQEAILAVTKNCQGLLLSSNQVLYADAFQGVKADVLYTYSRSGVMQEVVLKERLPDPASLGFEAGSINVEVLTEWFELPESVRIEPSATSPESHDVDFGLVRIGRGRAFWRDPGTPSGLQGASPGDIPVRKQLFRQDGRAVLYEAVPYSKLREELNKLPPRERRAELKPKARTMMQGKMLRQVPVRLVADVQPPRPMEMAAANSQTPTGFVLDWSTVEDATDFTFQGDTTYCVTDLVYLNGTTTLEGGTVVKYDDSEYAGVLIEGPVDCRTTAYRPAVFTSLYDDTQGENINSGPPRSYPYGLFLGGNSPYNLRNLRIAYADVGISFQGFGECTNEFHNVQLLHCETGVTTADADVNVSWYNGLLWDCDYGIALTTVLTHGHFLGQHLTVHETDDFGGAGTVTLYNCLLVDVNTVPSYGGSGNVDLSGVAGDGIFAPPTVGGRHYLIDGSTNRNAGVTTGIDEELLPTLRQMTTYSPTAYTNVTLSGALAFSPQVPRDTNALDVGYHYGPLDYVFGGVSIAGTATVAPGTALGWFRTSSDWYHAGHGITLSNSSSLTFGGRPEAPILWVRCNLVQETGNDNWGYGPGGITGWTWPTFSQAPQITARFTHFGVLGGEWANHYRDDCGFLVVTARDCEFWNGSVGGYVSSHSYTNCLFDRNNVWLQIGNPNTRYTLHNCTMNGGLLLISRSDYTPVSIWNSSFDATTVSVSDALKNNPTYTDYQNNAFLTGADRTDPTNANDVVATTFAWQSIGDRHFYLLSNSELVDAGSCVALDVGLGHFSNQSNQDRECTSVVDIGYHYVTFDANGQPHDSDHDGIPDWEDPTPDADGDGLPDAFDPLPLIPDTESVTFEITSPEEDEVIP